MSKINSQTSFDKRIEIVNKIQLLRSLKDDMGSL